MGLVKLKEFTLADRFDIKGYWWLPETKDQKIKVS